MKNHFFDVDATLREISPHGSEDFPVAVYLQQINRNKDGYLILHWHEEIQFVIQHHGKSYYTAGEKDYELKPGDVLFINSKCLHMAKQLTTNSDYICIDIHPQFLYGYSGSRIHLNYVMPYLSSSHMGSLFIDGSQPWHEELKKLLDRFVTVYEASEFAHEMEIQKLAIEIWLLIISNNRDKGEDGINLTPAEEKRIEQITNYIQNHYSEKITLKDIASEAGISDSECCRFVKRALNTTPMAYLNTYRIIKSTNFLQSTNMSVTEISQAVGFGTSSYFTERFKEMMNCRPLEYRRRFAAYRASANRGQGVSGDDDKEKKANRPAKA
ncbi:MAG: AraC family transcriptional regulator [Lachnospiraceae bacterium]|nr:AraC family transcriptional regulator [Lachnospiraceae bacterium]